MDLACADMANAVPVPVSSGMQLWEKAFDQLPEDMRNRLLSLKPHAGDVLISVRDEAEKGRQKCLRSRFKFTRSTGEVVIVRDVLEKIVRWVDRFKQIGDTAVQYSPEVAALPWAAVRFVLQSAVSEIQYFGSVIADLEVISRLVTRQTELERQLSSQTSSRFHDALIEAKVGLYADILTHLARFQKFFGESTAVRIAKGPFRDIDNDRMRSVLEREDEVVKISNMMGMETLQKLEIAFTRLSLSAADYSLSLADEKFKQVRDWLTLSPYNRHHAYVSESRLPGTGQWLLSHPQYADWHTSSCSSVLLLHGILGSGKSTLTSLVIDTLSQTAAQYPSPAPLAFFYCANSDWERDRASSDSVMRTIVWQLCLDTRGGRRVHDSLLAEYERKAAVAKIDGFDTPRLHTVDCVRLVLELAQQNPLTIIVDALDTLDQKERHGLTKALSDIVSKADNVVKVFVSTRTDDHLRSTLNASNCINITAEETHVDMATFIEHRIATIDSNQWLLDFSSSLHDTVAQFLLENAGEMFLWVRLQVDRIACEHFESDVTSILQGGLPTDLNTIYETIMNRIMSTGSQARETARRLLIWVLHAKEPLPPSAIISALGASHGSLITYNQLARLCANMVVIDEKCNVLRFSHQSFQDFLAKRDEFSVMESHGTIASDCIDACSLPWTEHNETTFPLATFHDYATIYWPLHFAQAQGSSSYEELSLKARSFIFDDDFDTSLAFAAWRSRLSVVRQSIPVDHALKTRLDAISSFDLPPVPGPDLSPLFLMSAFGMGNLMGALPLPIFEASVNHKNEFGHRPLYLAAAFGHATAVSYLTKHGAGINVECGRLGSPLHAACFSGHTEVVRQLLELNADLGCGSLFKDALEASCLGHQEKIALLLLQNGCIEQSEKSYELALQQAARAGFPQVVNWIQSSPLGSRLGEGKRFQKTTKAIQSGHIPALKLFLCDKSNVSSLLPPGAVAIATLHSHPEMVEFLLDKGMSIEANGVFGSPLTSAAMINSSVLVNLLLDRGANVDAHGPIGDAMQVAAAKGHDTIIRILLARNANVNQHSGFYGYAIQAAAYHGHELAVKLLLDAGAETNPRRPGHWKNAYQAALEGGHPKIASVLPKRTHQRLPFGISGWLAGKKSHRKSVWLDDRKGVLQAPYYWDSNHETIMWDAMAAEKLSRRCEECETKKKDALRLPAHPLNHETILWISELSAIYTPASAHAYFREMQALICDWPTTDPVKDITPQMALLSAVYHGYVDLMAFLVHEFSLNINQAMFPRSIWHHHAVVEVATALEIAVHQRHPAPMILALAQAGATIPLDDDGWSRLLDSVFFSYSKREFFEIGAEHGMGAILILMLSKAPDRKAHGPRFGLALQMAAAADNHAVVDLLLAHQVDVNFVTHSHGTALYAASIRGHYLMAQKLVNAGAIVNLGRKRPCWLEYPLRNEPDCIESPIHAASAHGHLEKVKELLNRGADANQSQPDFEGVTPLTLAATKGHVQVLRLLISAGADINRSRALENAAHPEMMDELLSKGAKVACDLDIGCMLSREGAERDRICRLIQNNCSQETWKAIVSKAFESQSTTDLAFRHLTAQTSPTMELLTLACKRGFLQSVQHILDYNPFDVNSADVQSGRHLLQHAASEDRRKVFFPFGNKRNLAKYSILRDKIRGCKQAIKLLITNGADVNDDSQSPPPLHLARSLGSEVAVEDLLDAGASLDGKKGAYEQPIFAAIDGNHSEIVKLLIDRGHPTDHRHSEHGTPLDYARALGRSAAITGLLGSE